MILTQDVDREQHICHNIDNGHYLNVGENECFQVKW
jgi:hypothetical protein